MIRLILLRVLICSWAIPVNYVFLLPLCWLVFGGFKRELDHFNKFSLELWKGEL